MPQLIATVEGVEVKHVFLTKDRTTLGRRPHNDIVLNNLAVSGDHCLFELKGLADVFIQDLGSTNGTFVNSDKVVRRQALHDGDLNAIGRFRIEYLMASETPSVFSSTAIQRPDTTSTHPQHASLQVLNGSSAGLEVPVVKTVTTFGKPGVALVAISHRRHGYYVALMDGQVVPTLNGLAITAEPQLLSNLDVLELAGSKLLFLLKD